MPLDTSAATLPRLKGDEQLANLGQPERVWAVGSIYGRYGALVELHNQLEQRIRPRDRVVYLGNYLGAHSSWTGEGIAVIDELIGFRNALIAVPGFFASDVVHLHGQGEDLLRHVRRLPFQKNHAEWVAYALAYGLESYTSPYGTTALELQELSHQGLHAMNKWAHRLGQIVAAHVGHAAFFSQMKTAAFSKGLMHAAAAFVPAGFDPTFPLAMQHDLLCWPERDVYAVTAWNGYSRVIRGQSFAKEAPNQRPFVLTLDDGLGLNGKLYAACLDASGHMLDWMTFG